MAFGISFALYTLAIIAVGLYATRFGRETDEDYFLAGRGLGPWVASLSASASSMSGWVTMGLVGTAFTKGYVAYWVVPGCMLGFLFNWFVMAGPMRNRAAELSAVTLPDFLAFHFRERWPVLRLMSVVVIFLAMLLYVAAQFAAAGQAFEAAFDSIQYKWGVVIGASIVAVYTVIGGFRAACWTDFLQALTMVGALLILPIVVLIDHGGWSFIHEQLGKVDPQLLDYMPQKTGFALVGFLLGSGALGINLGYPGQPHILVRFMGMRDAKDARLGGVIANVWAALLLWGAITLGIVIRALTIDGAEWTGPLAAELAASSDGTGGETAMVLASRHLLSGVFGGVVLAAVLAAIASTADSQVIVAASAAANDVYARLISPEKGRSHMLINRAAVFLLCLGAALLVINQNVTIYTYVLTYGWAILGAAFGPQVILILLWKRATYAGCVAGMVSGFAVTLLWNEIYKPGDDGIPIYNLTAAFATALVVNVVASLVTKPPTHA